MSARGDEDRVSAGTREQSRIEAAVVHRDRYGLEPRPVDGRAVPDVAWLLDGDASRMRAAKYMADERQCLREASADDDSVGRSDGSAYSAEVVGQCLAQGLGSEDVGVSECRGGELGERATVVAEPLPAREQCGVG